MSHRFIPILAAALLCRSALAQEPAAAPPVSDASPAPAATPQPSAKSGKKSGSRSGPRLKYVAPAGAASTPAGKASKGAEPTGNVPTLQALAPNHTALTINEHPSLAWFQKRPSKTPLEVTLSAADKPEPLMTFHLDQSPKFGIVTVSLADQKVSLDPGVIYTWTVTLVIDPADRAKDIKSSGTLKRTAPPAGLEASLAKADPAGKAILLAGAGVWYDALSTLNAAIASNQQDSSLRELRASLLKQGGFLEIGAAERP